MSNLSHSKREKVILNSFASIILEGAKDLSL